jgi:hypothetical protein
VRGRHLFVVCAAVVAVAMVAPAAPASAKTFRSSVVIDIPSCSGTSCTFYGHVGSPHRKCRPHRKVKVFHETDLVGTDRTSDNGFWGATFPLEEGNYRAKVTRRVLRNGDVCKGDTSETVHITTSV